MYEAPATTSTASGRSLLTVRACTSRAPETTPRMLARASTENRPTSSSARVGLVALDGQVIATESMSAEPTDPAASTDDTQ